MRLGCARDWAIPDKKGLRDAFLENNAYPRGAAYCRPFLVRRNGDVDTGRGPGHRKRGAWSTSDADATLSVNPSDPVPANPIAGGDITAINAANVNGHLASAHHNTFTGGLEGGYNYVTKSGFLFGLETDINIFNIKRSGTTTAVSVINPANTFTVDQSLHTDFLWTLRARAGYTFMDKFLIFASGRPGADRDALQCGLLRHPRKCGDLSRT
jgi:opacity protein-like surface antigen